MNDIIQRHLDTVDQLQSEIEAAIRDALAALTPQDILRGELPDEVVQELRQYVESHLLDLLVAEANRFVQELGDDDEDEEAPEEPAVDPHRLIVILLDHYLVSVSAFLTSISTEISNQAQLQVDLGRSQDSVQADLAKETNALGALVASIPNRLARLTDSFVASASGIAVTGAAKGVLTWVDVHDKRECPDCLTRHGQSATLAEWTQRGLPRSGWSVCGGSCRCILVPSKAHVKAGSPGPVERKRR